MEDVLGLAGLAIFVSPLIGAFASGAGRIWGNVLTAFASAVWAGVILSAVASSGDTRGPYPAIGVALAAAAVAELALAWLLAGRRAAGRTDDGSLRAASVVVALVAMVLVVVLVYLIVAAMAAFYSML